MERHSWCSHTGSQHQPCSHSLNLRTGPLLPYSPCPEAFSPSAAPREPPCGAVLPRPSALFQGSPPERLANTQSFIHLEMNQLLPCCSGLVLLLTFFLSENLTTERGKAGFGDPCEQHQQPLVGKGERCICSARTPALGKLCPHPLREGTNTRGRNCSRIRPSALPPSRYKSKRKRSAAGGTEQSCSLASINPLRPNSPPPTTLMPLPSAQI